MTNGEFFSKLKHVKGVVVADGADGDVMQRLTDQVELPAAHLEFLKIANGVSIFGGYFRLFGFSSPTTIDMIEWNSPGVWKFAWNKPLDEFWFFGETAWGDQYAYRKDELNRSSTPRVFFLQGITMKEEVIASDFGSFLENEFLRNAIQPYDDYIIAARKRLGDLEPLEHIAYVPSLLIAGAENIDLVSKLNAVSSMVINGDLWNQLADEPQDRPIKEVQSYEDSSGHMRLRVVWD